MGQNKSFKEVGQNSQGRSSIRSIYSQTGINNKVLKNLYRDSSTGKKSPDILYEYGGTSGVLLQTNLEEDFAHNDQFRIT